MGKIDITNFRGWEKFGVTKNVYFDGGKSIHEKLLFFFKVHGKAIENEILEQMKSKQ